MSGSSQIDWPPATWNPVTGCHQISADGGHGNGLQLARHHGRPQGLDELASRPRPNARRWTADAPPRQALGAA